ncbi:hypothetical protein PYJP_18130 [Pyrofollis japonicus]|nr:hypothetical protein PYJP_18130 [Pyrofollis japonicus]
MLFSKIHVVSEIPKVYLFGDSQGYGFSWHFDYLLHSLVIVLRAVPTKDRIIDKVIPSLL